MHVLASTDDLRLRRVLVVEDEYLIARALAEGLSQRGVIVVGPASDLTTALALADAEPLDAAILDINLDGQSVYPLADTLLQAEVPFGFATGYDLVVIPEQYRAVPFWQKPCTVEALAGALRAMIRNQAAG